MKTNLKLLLKVGLSSLTTAVLIGCSSEPKCRTVYVPLPPGVPPGSRNDAIWVPDQFSEYSVGRYVDPHQPGVLHDAHSLYRREQSGRWNLEPAGAPARAATSASPENNLLHDALTAELNRQRASSQTLIGQVNLLDQRLRELNLRSREFQDAVQESYRLRDQMTVVSNRLQSVEGQLHRLPEDTNAPIAH